MIKVQLSLPDTQSLKEFAEEKYGLKFSDFILYRNIGGAVYFTKSAGRPYIFKLSIAQYSEKAVRAVQVISFLKQNNFSAVSVIPTKDGELYVNTEMPEGNRIGALFEFIGGGKVTAEDMYEIGRVTAEMHKALIGYKGDLPFIHTKENYTGLLSAKLRENGYDNSKISELEEYGQVLWNRLKDEPCGIIHGDLDIGNIMKQNAVFKIIDFDNTAAAPLLYDAAAVCSRMNYIVVNQSDIKSTRAAIKLFSKGYREISGSAFDESKILNFTALKKFEAFGHAMNRFIPVTGNKYAELFMNTAYQWLIGWKRIFN
jgi:Ser/Thr protein kinase RdoA (MazF antagonist)